MDANTYYLNQYLDQVDQSYSNRDRAEWIAQQDMEDPASDFYPWTPERIFEAMAEAPDEALERMAQEHADDRGLSTVVREIVLAYWFESAVEHFLTTGE